MPDLFRYPGVYLDSRLRGNDVIEVFNLRSNIAGGYAQSFVRIGKPGF